MIFGLETLAKGCAMKHLPMKTGLACVACALGALGASAVGAAEGLVAPAADALWPRWQARVAVQTSTASPLSGGHFLEASAPRGVKGGAVLGDYYFATPSFVSFRASGGVLMGLNGGLPMTIAAPGTRLGVAVGHFSAPVAAAGIETPAAGALPYMGFGFSGALWRSSLAVSADIGWVADGVGRAVFGNQGMDGAVREIRLSPVLQLGVRYSF